MRYPRSQSEEIQWIIKMPISLKSLLISSRRLLRQLWFLSTKLLKIMDWSRTIKRTRQNKMSRSFSILILFQERPCFKANLKDKSKTSSKKLKTRLNWRSSMRTCKLLALTTHYQLLSLKTLITCHLSNSWISLALSAIHLKTYLRTLPSSQSLQRLKLSKTRNASEKTIWNMLQNTNFENAI